MSRNYSSLQLQEEAVDDLRQKICGKNYLDQCQLESNTFLLRYLKSTRLDVSKAEKRIQNYWKHCNTKKLESLAVEIPKEYQKIFKIYTGARDYQNRPVIQIPNMKDWLRKLMDFDKKDQLFVSTLIKRVHWHLEDELLAIDVENAVVILDLQDISYTMSLATKVLKLCVELTKELLSVSPGLVDRSIVLNAPKIVKRLNGIAHTVLRLTPEQREQSIIFSPGDIDWKEQLLNFVPADQLRPEFGGTFTGYQLWFE